MVCCLRYQCLTRTRHTQCCLSLSWALRTFAFVGLSHHNRILWALEISLSYVNYFIYFILWFQKKLKYLHRSLTVLWALGAEPGCLVDGSALGKQQELSKWDGLPTPCPSLCWGERGCVSAQAAITKYQRLGDSTTEMYFLIALEAVSPRPRDQYSQVLVRPLSLHT